MSSKSYGDINLYKILGIDLEAQESEIRKAYRKKALECHPDKNPDNPRAAELFHELANALQVLTDISARSAYDKVLKAKKAAEIRHKQLDGKRKKLKEDLEQRERDALHHSHSKSSYSVVQKSDEELLYDQIERLRREGSRLLEEEQRLLKEQLQKTLNDHHKKQSSESSTHRLKIKWNSEKKDPLNGGYTQVILMNYLKKYGEVTGLVMSKKCGSALVEFKSLEAAEMAVAYEKGIIENPLRFEWIPSTQSKVSDRATQETSTVSSSKDYEDLVMRKLRQAEERKRLIEQMQNEEEVE